MRAGVSAAHGDRPPNRAQGVIPEIERTLYTLLAMTSRSSRLKSSFSRDMTCCGPTLWLMSVKPGTVGVGSKTSTKSPQSAQHAGTRTGRGPWHDTRKSMRGVLPCGTTAPALTDNVAKEDGHVGVPLLVLFVACP